MALTRSQLLAGNQAQGVVLEGQVQGVKQGAGVKIEPDGTIKVDASTAEGLVKLNNPLAFNGYVWPNTSGSVGQFLTDDGSGNLSWGTPNISSTVTVSDVAPTGSLIGRLWFDTTEFILKVYEDDTGIAKWTPVSRGMDAEAGNASSTPPFVEGTGSEEEPFVLSGVSVLGGGFARFEEVITVSGFAPYQYVPIIDLNADINSNRFSSSSYFTDGNGILTFRVLFTDYPVSSGGIAYSAKLEVGFGSFYISAPVTITSPLTLDNVGTITGTPQVGQILNYTVGTASGGTAPYTCEWEWRRASDEAILQTNGDSYTISEAVDGDRVFVRLIATDKNNVKVSGSTGDYPTAPALIGKGPFPATNVLFPTSIGQEVTTTWLDPDTQLYADGCIEIQTFDGTNLSPWGQGPYNISNGGYVKTRWIEDSNCGFKPNGSVIVGCVYDSKYRECGSLVIDRIPSPFSFLPQSDLQPNSIAVALPITPVGYNARAYVTYTGISTLSEIKGSLDNGLTWVDIPVTNGPNANNFPIAPGQSLIVRGTTGGVLGAAYNAVINIGEGSSVQSATFTATNTNQSSFSTPVVFPTTTSQGYSIPGAASPSWSDGSTNLTATGCLDIQVESSGGTVIHSWGAGPFSISDGQILRTRWKNTVGCGGAPHGTMISGTVTNVPSGGTKTSQGSMMIDRVVGAFTFQDLTGQQVSTQVSSNTVLLSGFNATTYLTASGTLTGLEASIGGGSWQSVPTSGTSFPIEPVPSGSTPVSLAIRGTTGASTSTEYTSSVNVGSDSFVTSDTWNVTTSEAVKTVVTPSITSPTNGATGINPTTLNPPGINVTASAYQVINGASTTQLNSEWEVRSGSTSGAVVYSQTKTSAFTSWFIPLSDGSNTLIFPNTQYFVRVRYRSNDNVVSQWSTFSQFTTATTFTQTWVKRADLSIGIGNNTIHNNGSRWIAVGGDGSAVTSTDAITWANIAMLSGVTNTVLSISYGNNVWLTVGEGYSGVRRSSNNGASWSTPTNTGLTSNTLFSIAFANGTFVAVGDSTIQTTTDGNIWTTRTTPSNVSGLSQVIWDGSNFIAIGSQCLIYSPTGTSWTRVTTPQSGTVNRITYLPGETPRYLINRPYFVPGSATVSTNTIYVSTNLTSWTAQTLPSNRIQYAAAGNGVFVIGDWLDGSSGLNVWASPSGLTGTWVKQTLPVTLSNYRTHYLNFGTTSTGIGRFVLIDHAWNIFSTT